MRKIILILTIALLSVRPSSAQEIDSSLVLSLQQAIDHALENNKSLQNARSELEKANKSIWEAISSGLPQADILVDYMTYFGYELEFAFGPDEDFEFSQEQLNEAQVQTLAEFSGVPMAGLNPVTPQDLYNYSAGQYYSSTLQSMMPPSTILMSDQLTAKLQVSQLIFSGQYIVGIQTAKLAKQIADLALNNSETGTKEAVISAYYLVLISQRSLDFVEDNLKNLKKILAQTEKMAEIGMAEKIDADQFQVTVNQLENTRRSMERNLEVNYNMLRFTLGIPADTRIMLTDELESLFDEMAALDLLLRDFNVENNLSYQMLDARTEVNKKLWDMEKWNFGPTLAGFYNYNFKLLTTGFDMTPNHLAGFSFSLPIISSGMRKMQVDQARIEYEMSERDKEILSDQLKLQNSQLKYDLQSSIENYNTQKESVKVAREVLENYRLKYENGMASSLDVTQANSSLLETQGTYLSAMFEVMNARIQLEKLMNNLSNL